MEAYKILFIVGLVIAVGIGYLIAIKVKNPLLLMILSLLYAAFGMAWSYEIANNNSEILFAQFVSQALVAIYSVAGGGLVSLAFSEIRPKSR